MCRSTNLALLVLALGALSGCQSHPLTDYRPLNQAGVWSSNIEELKKLNTSDAEVGEIVNLKQVGLSDDTCVALVKAAHNHHHAFASSASVRSLSGASFSDEEILQIARADQLDVISGDAVTLRLIGLSDATVQMLLQRKLQGTPTLSSGEIADLKNTGLTESQIVQRIKDGMTDAQAEAEVTARKKASNQTGFVRIHGRRPR